MSDSMQDTETRHDHELPSRRSFLSSASAVGAYAFVAQTWPPRQVTSERAGVTRWQIEAVRVTQTFGDGSTVPFFRFRSLTGTPSNGALPLLRAPERSKATLSITNNVGFPIQPTILGLRTGPVVAPGQTAHMEISMPIAGTWLLTEALLGLAAGPVGFGAVLVSTRSPGRLAINQLPTDREYTLLYQDADDRWNNAVDAGQAPDTSVYEPNYHTVNGLNFPALAGDPDSRVVCSVGERVLLRIGNLGHVRQTVHFHGYHVRVRSLNNARERFLGEKDTVGVRGHTTAELVLPVRQPGIFPIHPHSLTTVTDNGLYPAGQITLIEAT